MIYFTALFVYNSPLKRSFWCFDRVNIDFKLLNWKYMNFQMKFKEDTRIFTIKKILQQRHGRLDNLRLCFHSFVEANEINDEMLTLKDCGFKGVPWPPLEANQVDQNGASGADEVAEEKSIPTVILFYDFKPIDCSDPVVLYFK